MKKALISFARIETGEDERNNRGSKTNYLAQTFIATLSRLFGEDFFGKNRKSIFPIPPLPLCQCFSAIGTSTVCAKNCGLHGKT